MKGGLRLSHVLEEKEKLLISTLIRHPSASRSDLARLTHMQPSVIGEVATELIGKRFLVDIGVDNNAEPRQAGRPGRQLKVDDTHWLLFALDLEPDCLRIGLFSLTCDVVAYAEHGLDRFGTNENIVTTIHLAVNGLLGGNENWRARLCGAGISLPGRVDARRGVLERTTNMPRVKDLAVGDLLQDLLGVSPCSVRSIHAACLAEKWRRPAETLKKNILCLILRTGVGTTLMVQGKMYRGASGMDGEIGHTIVDLNGEPCECGKRGCLETFVSSAAIKRRGVALMKTASGAALHAAVDGDPAHVTPEMIYRLVRRQDPGCTELVREIAHVLGVAVANLVETLNPHEVVVCGAIDEAEQVIVEEIQQVFGDYLLPDIRCDVSVVISPLKGRASLYGAAGCVLEQLLKPMPRYTRKRAVEKEDAGA